MVRRTGTHSMKSVHPEVNQPHSVCPKVRRTNLNQRCCSLGKEGGGERVGIFTFLHSAILSGKKQRQTVQWILQLDLIHISTQNV